MKQTKYLFLTVQQFVLLITILLTTVIFFLALYQGNDGVTLKIFGGGDDGAFYWNQAQNVVAGKEWTRTSIYPLIIGYLIKFTGVDSPYIVRLFNYFGFILLIIFSFNLIKLQFLFEVNRFSPKTIYRTRILLLLSFLFYVSLQMNINLSILRDIWIYTLYVISIAFSIRLIFFKKNRLINILGLFISLWFLGEFRKYALLSFVLAISIYFLYRLFRRLNNSKIFTFFVIILFGIYYSLFIDYTIPIVNMSLRQALTYRAMSLTTYSGGSQMWISLNQPNYFLFLLNYIHSYIGNLLGPLPWHIKGVSTLIIFIVESIPMILIIRFLWKKRRLLSKVQHYILLHAFVWISLIAISNDNLGTAMRLRPVAWTLILIVFVVIYSKNKYLNSTMEKRGT